MEPGKWPPKYKVLDLFDLAVGSLSLTASLLAVWVFFASAGTTVQSFGVIVAISAVAFAFSKLLKLRAFALTRLTSLAGAFHKFTDTLRDEYFTLHRHYDKKELSHAHLLLHAKSTSQRCVDYLAEALTASTGFTVSVCVKYFPDDVSQLPPTRPEDHYLKTLCRSANSSPLRDNQSRAKVGENSGYLALIKDQRSEFRAQDLPRQARLATRFGYPPYRSSNTDWTRHYRTTIAVPIRMKRELFQTEPQPEGFRILGLLCADSLNTSAFPTDHIEAYTDLMKAFADALYIYFDRVYYYLSVLRDPVAGGKPDGVESA